MCKFKKGDYVENINSLYPGLVGVRGEFGYYLDKKNVKVYVRKGEPTNTAPCGWRMFTTEEDLKLVEVKEFSGETQIEVENV